MVSVLMTSAAHTMILNVTREPVSATANVRDGGTKKKAQAATLRREAHIAGPRPPRIATTAPSWS